MKTQDYLEYVHNLASNSADTDKPFWYLSGPMSGYPQYNFPAFAKAAETLRGFGYNLVSPAELDDSEVYAAVINDPQGTSLDSDDHARLLARDLIIVSMRSEERRVGEVCRSRRSTYQALKEATTATGVVMRVDAA